MTSAGSGMTPLRAAAGNARVTARATACAAALRVRTILEPYRTDRTITTLRDWRVAADPLQLEAEVQVVLRAVLVEGPRLRLVQAIVFERGIVQVHGVERDREVLVHGVAQRRGQGSDGVLSERRASVEAAVERRPVGVRHPGIEHRV